MTAQLFELSSARCAKAHAQARVRIERQILDEIATSLAYLAEEYGERARANPTCEAAPASHQEYARRDAREGVLRARLARSASALFAEQLEASHALETAQLANWKPPGNPAETKRASTMSEGRPQTRDGGNRRGPMTTRPPASKEDAGWQD